MAQDSRHQALLPNSEVAMTTAWDSLLEIKASLQLLYALAEYERIVSRTGKVKF